MANPIIEQIDKMGTAWAEYQKINDQRLEEVKNGNEARAKELSAQLEKLDKVLTEAVKSKRDAENQLVAMRDRVELLEALADRPKGSPQEKIEGEYKNLFLQSLRKRFNDPEINDQMYKLQKQAVEYKDVTIGSTIGGGYGLPKEISASIDKLILKFSDIVNEVKTVQVGTSDYQELVSIHGGTSGWVSEVGSRTATGTPNLRNCKPTWGELYAYPQVSEWSLQDIFFNVQEWLTGDIADGMAVALSTAIWNGNGSARPTGMTNTTPVTTDDYASPLRAATAYEYMGLATPNSPNRLTEADSIIDLVYLLRAGYRQGAKFAMNSVTQGAVRKLKDQYGQYLWQPSLQLGQPDQLLGYPVFTWEDMGNHNVVDAFAIAFGNFKRAYTLAYRTELAVTLDQVTNPGYVRFYVRRRYAGIPTNNDAVKFLRIAD